MIFFLIFLHSQSFTYQATITAQRLVQLYSTRDGTDGGELKIN